MNQKFEISNKYIELNKLLKASGLCDSGGFAKMVIKDGLVTVDGEIETRVRRKIKNEGIVQYNNQTLQVISKTKI
jgi:ribosome-associated protein